MTTATSRIFSDRYLQLMRRFPLREIRTKKDADAATKVLDRLFREKHDDPGEEAYVHFLTKALEEYEDRHERVPDTATGLDVLRHMMDEHDMKQVELAELLGIGPSAVSMILSAHRPITADHARKLGKRFHVEPGLFI